MFRTTSGLTLIIVEHGTMTTSPLDGTSRTHALSTGLVGEDAQEVGRHDDERSRDVSTGEGWELTDPMAGVISLNR